MLACISPTNNLGDCLPDDLCSTVFFFALADVRRVLCRTGAFCSEYTVEGERRSCFPALPTYRYCRPLYFLPLHAYFILKVTSTPFPLAGGERNVFSLLTFGFQTCSILHILYSFSSILRIAEGLFIRRSAPEPLGPETDQFLVSSSSFLETVCKAIKSAFLCSTIHYVWLRRYDQHCEFAPPPPPRALLCVFNVRLCLRPGGGGGEALKYLRWQMLVGSKED